MPLPKMRGPEAPLPLAIFFWSLVSVSPAVRSCLKDIALTRRLANGSGAETRAVLSKKCCKKKSREAWAVVCEDDLELV